MSSLQDSILRYIDEQLDTIESTPSTWGPPLCVEVQVLQLLEFRAIALSPERKHQKNSQAVLDVYEEFLARKFPGNQPSPLALLLEAENRTAELASILGEFRRQLVHRMEAAQPEDIFADHDLVLKLWMKSGITIPPARALSSYYGTFHRALRALAIPYSGQARASRDLAELFELPDDEYAVDFVMSEVRVIPAHGAPAQLILPLNQRDPANQLDQARSASTEQIRAGLEDIVIVNEWAAMAGSRIAELRDDLRGKESPQRIAAQVLRLIPGKEAAAQAVELSGRLVKRSQPIKIMPSYAARMLEVIQDDRSTRRDFDRVGTVRAVDMDQHSIRINVEGRSFKCWIEDPERIKAACDSLGERVRVIGYEYREPGSAVIVVREIRR